MLATANRRELLGLATVASAKDASPDELGWMSLQDLGDVQVTPVSKLACDLNRE